MTHTIRLIKDMKLGDLNLLAGSTIISTDDLGGIVGMGLAVKVVPVPPAPPARAEVVEVREPKISNREPKIQRSKLI